jgi:ribosomal protein L12E/L44/L45/RPP1/RPP2
MGIYASGQTYEQLILHLLAHPLPEARRNGQMILEAVQAVMPSFVTRVERPDRGGEWIAYLEGRERAADRWVRRLGLDRESEPDARPSVRLLHVDGDEDALLAALLFEAAGVGEEETRIRLAALSGRRAHRALRRTSSACAPTAATGPAAASRRCATASRSSRTTAPSATSSATGCSRSSGSA